MPRLIPRGGGGEGGLGGGGGYRTEAKSDCFNTLDKTPVVWLKLMGQARILKYMDIAGHRHAWESAWPSGIRSYGW